MSKSRLEQVLDAVKTRTIALYPGVTFNFGEPNVALNGAPPRVSWFRAEQGTTTGPARTTARDERVALLDRSTAVEAVCWAAKGGSYDTDDAALEALVDALETALRSELGTALVLPIVEAWTTEGWTQIGKSARVAFAVRQPVVIPQPEVLDASTNPEHVGFDDGGKSDTDGILQAKDG